MNMKILIAVVVALLLGLLWFVGQRPQMEMGPQPHAMLPTVAIAQGGLNQIALVNPATGEIVRIDVNPNTHGVGVLPNGSKAYAASFGADEISVVDLAQKREVAKVNIGAKSHHIEISPDGRWAYVTAANDTVAVIDTRTDTLAATIAVPPGPMYTVFSPDGRFAYVTSMKGGMVSVLDVEAQKVIKEIPVGKGPDHAAITPDGRFLYVTNRNDGTVSVVDTQQGSVVATIPVGKGPHGVAVVERGGKLLAFVGNRGETTISIIDPATNEVIETFDLGASPEHLTPSPDRKVLFIGSIPAKKLFVYDVERGKIVKAIDVGGEIHQIVVVPPRQQARMPMMPMEPEQEKAMAMDVEYELVEVEGGSYRNIDAETLWQMLQQKDFVLINVHIPYAGELPETDLFIPYNAIEENLDKLPEDKDAKIVVYCRSGPMSAKAAATLVKLGYTNVWNLKQGMREWKEAGFPLLDKQE
jgi:YVTN family beta-propeller protein